MPRITLPAVGYVGVSPVRTGMTRPRVVSPTVRDAVNDPRLDVPVTDSSPFDAPSILREVLPCARPLTVRSLAVLIVVVAVRIVDVSPSSRPPGPRPMPQP